MCTRLRTRLRVPNPGRMDDGTVRRNVERALTRMGVASLDMMQFHWWDYGNKEYLTACGCAAGALWPPESSLDRGDREVEPEIASSPHALLPSPHIGRPLAAVPALPTCAGASQHAAS